MAGRKWTEEYLATLSNTNRKKVMSTILENGQNLSFGGGKTFAAQREIKALVMIGRRRY